MTIKISMFYPFLQKCVGDRRSIEVEGHTVGECLQVLIDRYPCGEQLLFDEKGQYLKHVFVYVNAESASKAVPAAPVKDGDEILIAVLVTGG